MSKSHYSLSDQTKIDKYFYQEKSFVELKNTMKSLKNDLGLLGIVDIVLNHTANNSEWI